MNQKFLYKTVTAIMVLMMACAPAGVTKAAIYKIGVLCEGSKNECLKEWYHTAKDLTDKLPGTEFQVVPLSFEEITVYVKDQKVDFLIINPSLYVLYETLYGVQPLATIKRFRCEHAGFSAGVIFTKANEKSINKVVDLKGRSFAAVSKNSFEGWITGYREFKRAGIDPEKGLKKLAFLNDGEKVVNAVLDGKFCAGIAKAGILRYMVKRGRLNMKDLKIIKSADISPSEEKRHSFFYSTEVYPDWVFAKMPKSPHELSNRVLITLLSIPRDDAAAYIGGYEGWDIAKNYQSVHECLQEVNYPPYEDYGKISFYSVLKEYWIWILFDLALIFVLFLILVRVGFLNKNLFLSQEKLHSEIKERKLAQDIVLAKNYELEIANLKLERNETALKDLLEDMKKTYNELKNAQNNLMQSEKLASIGQLAAGVAHEINNPVGFIGSNLVTLDAYISSFMDLLEAVNGIKQAIKDGDVKKAKRLVSTMEKIEKNSDLNFIKSDARDLLKESKEGVDRIKNIISNLKIFARPSEETKSYESVNKILDDVLSITWNEISFRAEITKEYEDVPFIECNPQQIGQVFINILVNASQSITGKGSIKIKTYEQNGRVFVEISDNGTGIEEGNLNKIFDPFFTTKDPGKGTGLGLSISYEIMKKHNGAIDVESKVGKGTTFILSFPAVFEKEKNAKDHK